MGKLVIDLGHGGHDPGAIGPNKTHEADVVLAIGKELNELLKGYELEVKFTRLSNVYLSLSERAKIANDFKADYQISSGWKINVQPSNKNEVLPYGKSPYTQVIFIKNEQNTPLQIKLNAIFKCYSHILSESCLIKNISL